MATAKIKKGDRVIVLAGKDKGKIGEVNRVIVKDSRVVVSGVNMVSKHQRPSQTNPNGGILRMEASIHISNVAHIDPKDNKATRVGVKTLDNGKTVRVGKRSGEQIGA